jgi:glycosyltransferase involved in cell wall biosynthesis
VGSTVWRDRIYRWTDGLADRTVAVSHAAAERHLQARAARTIEVIPNGVDTEIFRPDEQVRRRVRSSLGLGTEFVFVAVGRLMWKKNYPALLRAFRTLGGGTLLIVGTGPQERELRAMAGANVIFLGPREDVPELLNAADAYVLTSVVEGLPVALLEAGSVGLPCLATDAGGVRETGIATLVNEETLATEMNRLMSLSEPERRSRGEEARARVIEHYSLDTVVTQWEALYRSLDPWT